MKRACISGLKLAVLLGLLAVSQWLLGEDGGVFLKWWEAVLVLGLSCFPVTAYLFRGFHDRGWVVSKVLGIAFAGFLTWLLVTCGLASFTVPVCLGTAAVLAVISWAFWFWQNRRKAAWCENCLSGRTAGAVLDGELVFTAFFLVWTYLAGFHPAAHGTEKFMDYGFMMAMMRSDTLPARDLWYGAKAINYYYGGQYFAVYLTKLTFTQVAQTYNLMRTLVAGFAFALPFVLVRQMILDIRDRAGKHRAHLAVFGGLLAGAGVSLAGNMHYVVVGKLLPWIRRVFDLPEGDYTYWFPNSTRYIGYYPAGNDKTIHEFPSYSFVLGDLHAHVVNVMFVLAVICLIYAMAQRYRAAACAALGETGAGTAAGETARTLKAVICQALTEPYVWVFAFFIGLFHWTNYWDFVIYYVMGGLGIIYCNFLKYAGIGDKKRRLWMTAGNSAVHAVWVLLLGTLFALPFTLRFEKMVSGVALAQNHTRPYQWWLIWGLPFLMTLLYFWSVFRDWKKGGLLETSDFFGVILGFSAAGLILIPEIIYVRDIYEKEFARSNTMFKLTYQAFIMFGLVMGYAFVRLWIKRGRRIRKTLTTVGFLCFAGCCCYIGTAVHSWFGQVWDKEQYQGLDAAAYLESSFPEDASAIRWLNENVTGNPLVLEANGDSYSDYGRVSAMTGLPTVLGWYVHEWLWRGDTEDLNRIASEVETIYTSADTQLVESLLKEHEVEYIFVGKMEREKYAGVNEAVLQSLGNVIYRDENTQTYIIQCTEG